MSENSVKFIIATHGRFAEGILDSLEMIAGKQEHVSYINMYTDSDINYQERVKETIEKHDYLSSTLVVLTDISGGSVNTEFMRFLRDYPFQLVAGLSLPLLLELVFTGRDEIAQKINEVCKVSENFVVHCNRVLEQEVDSGILF